MKHLLALIALCVAFAAGAQGGVYNPDANGDFNVGTADLLAFLSLYGNTGFELPDGYSPLWSPDSDADGLIDVDDLLSFLGLFGENDSDNDGLWDSYDPCPSGVQYFYVDSIESIYDSVFSASSGDWLVEYVGEDTVWTETCEVTGCTFELASNFDPAAVYDDGSCEIDYGCIDSQATNFDPTSAVDDGSCLYACGQDSISYVSFVGYDYSVIQIGEQCWFAENLRTTKYSNGDFVTGGLSDEQWQSFTQGAQTIYGEGNSECFGSCNHLMNLSEVGRLYNSYAVTDSRNVCPVGWHVPTDLDWQLLEEFVGIPAGELDSFGWRGLGGVSLKSAPPDWNGEDEYGFSVKHSGYRNWSGVFTQFNDEAFFWTSTGDPNNDELLVRKFRTAQWGISREIVWPAPNGFSVRCLKDD